MDELAIIGRNQPLFTNMLKELEADISTRISEGSFLVVGLGLQDRLNEEGGVVTQDGDGVGG